MDLFSLFGARLPIDAEELEFQLATFKWLSSEFGDFAQAPLVLPTQDFFPSQGRRGVETLFEEVGAAAGMTDWPCELRPGDSSREIDAGNDHLLQHRNMSPCGTFQIVGEEGAQHAVITYNPSMERNADALVATFAHEFGHYLMATAKGTPPGGWDLHELHTDLAAVYLGFGIFLANSARHFSTFSTGRTSGWSASLQGYLSERALVTALVIVERLCGRDPMHASTHLKDYLRADLKRASRALVGSHPDMRRSIEEVDLAQFVGN